MIFYRGRGRQKIVSVEGHPDMTFVIVVILIAIVAVVYANWKKRSNGKDIQTSNHQEADANGQRTAGQQECKRLSGSTYYELLGVDRNVEEKPYQRCEQEVLSNSSAVSKRGRQAAVSSDNTIPTSRRISGTVRDRGIRTQSGRLSGYSYSPRRAYGGRSSYTLCRACRWGQRTIGSGRARSIRGVSNWASANCTCR